MTDKQIMLDGVDVLKEKINMCFILLLNKLETSETIEQTIYEHLDVFVEEWNKQLVNKEQECKDLREDIKDIANLLDLDTGKEYNFGNIELEIKQLKAKEQECEALQMSENEAGEIIAELKAYKDVNEDFKTAWKELKAENNELKKIINEAKNSKLDLKSFLVGEAVQNEYEQQLDKLKAENESLKDSLKMFSSTLDWALKSEVGLYKRQIDSSVPDDWEYEEVLVLVEQYIEKIKQTLAEIKEICNNNDELQGDFNLVDYDKYKLGKHNLANKILQKISECEVENDNK